MTPQRRQILAGAVIVAATLFAYMPAIDGGPIWDDTVTLTENEWVARPDGWRHLLFKLDAMTVYYPLTYVSFWAEYQLFGPNLRGYHIVNILLHAACALLLWRILKYLDIPGAWLAAAIFALHPLHAESVAWVSERKNTLSVMFYLCSLGVYAKASDGWRVTGGGSDPGHASPVTRHAPRYFLALVLFAAALLSKAIAVTLPAAILLIIWWRRGRIGWRGVVPVVPFFVLAATSGFLTRYIEIHSTGARGADWDSSIVERFLLAGRAIWFYAGKVVWPYPLTFIYPRWELDASDWRQWLWPIGVIVVIAVLWMLHLRIGRGPLAGVLYFAGTLFPALGFFAIYYHRFSFVADHFAYPATIGLIVLFAALLDRYVLSRGGSVTRVVVPAVLLLALCIATRVRAADYINEETMWRDTIAKNPASWLARANLAKILADRGEVGAAETEYIESLRLQPLQYKASLQYARMLEQQKRMPEAIAQLRQAVRARPEISVTHFALGEGLARAGDAAGAQAAFEEALRLSPESEMTRMRLAELFASQSKFDVAVEHYRIALRANPSSAPLHSGLASVLFKSGQLDDAVTHMTEAIRLRPDNPLLHNNLGAILMQSGRPRDAAQQFEAALQLDPTFAQARDNLAAARRALKSSP